MQASTLPSVSEAGDGRHLAAILFADLVGYSRLMTADEGAQCAAIGVAWSVVAMDGRRAGDRGNRGAYYPSFNQLRSHPVPPWPSNVRLEDLEMARAFAIQILLARVAFVNRGNMVLQ